MCFDPFIAEHQLKNLFGSDGKMKKQDGKWKVFLLADLAAHQKIEWDLNTNTKTHSYNIFWVLKYLFFFKFIGMCQN